MNGEPVVGLTLRALANAGLVMLLLLLVLLLVPLLAAVLLLTMVVFEASFNASDTEVATV